MAHLFNSGAIIGVTGANGFIGRAVRKALEKAGAEFFAIEGDVRDSATFNRDFDVLIHLAAKTPDASGTSFADIISINVAGTANALEVCRKRGAAIVFSSSSGIYRPNTERTALHETAPAGPAWLYPRTKWLGELLCMHYSNAHRVQCRILRLFNVYGPGQPEFFLIAYLIRCALAGETALIRNRHSVRDWIHVDDVADALVRSAFCDRDKEVFNIGTGVPTEMETLTTLLAETDIGTNFRYSLQDSGTDPTPVVYADIRAARSALAWEPRRSLADGLPDCIRHALSGADEN